MTFSKYRTKNIFLVIVLTLVIFLPSASKSKSASLSDFIANLEGESERDTKTTGISEGITAADKKAFDKLLKKVYGRSLYEEKQKSSKTILEKRWERKLKKRVMRVYATSFGNPGNNGESNYFKDGSKVRKGIIAVALPDASVIGKWVEVRRLDLNGKRSRWVKMKIKDLGPWFRNDPYWKKKNKTPRAVNYFKKKRRRFDGRVVVNPAGMDITPWGWQKIGIDSSSSYNHSQYVEWRFAK